MTCLILALALVQTQEAIALDDVLVDSVVCENFALTKVRIVMSNASDRLDRAVAFTVSAPEDAVLFEFDAYGAVDGDREVVCEAARGLPLFIRLADAARDPGAGPVTTVPTTVDMLKFTLKKTLDELNAAARYSQAFVRFVVTKGRSSGNAPPSLSVSYSHRIVPRRSPSLVQQSAPGRFQVMLYPLPMKSEQTFEVYFAHFARKLESGAYELEFPFSIKGPGKLLKSHARVRIVSKDDVVDPKCFTHKADVVQKKGDLDHAELKFDLDGYGDIRVGYGLGAKAEPVSEAEPDLKKKWTTWAKRKDADPLGDPARALQALAGARAAERLRKDDKREEALKAALESRAVTPLSSILIAGNDLLLNVGEKPPKEMENPFRSPRVVK